MTFIGIISDEKSFERIKEKVKENINGNIQLISINKKSIGNIKNIRFETIIIDSDMKKFKQEEYVIKQLCSYAKYLIVNTDLNLTFSILNHEKINIITYGHNQKATVTTSSITDTDILIYLQRNIKNIDGKVIEVGEKRILIDQNNRLKTYEILIIYILFLLYNNNIMNET